MTVATQDFLALPADEIEQLFAEVHIASDDDGQKSAIAIPFEEGLHPRDWRGRFADKPDIKLGRNWLGRLMRASGLRRRGFGPSPLALLVTTSERDMHDYAAPPLGRLLVPDNWSRADDSQGAGVVVACDNGGFFGVDEAKYKHMCERLKAQGVTPAWVTVPDVIHHLDDGTAVGDAKATIARFGQWSQYLKRLGFPAAFVAQDGMDSPENLAWLERHWNDMSAVFIGGSDTFKLGPAAATITRLAHEHGKVVHVGRVNSQMRLSYSRDVLQADSCDGKQWAQFKKLTLAGGLEYIPSGDAPATAMGKRWVTEALKATEEGTPWPRPPWKGHSWIGYFGEPLPENAPEGAKIYYGHFSDTGEFIKALTTVVYYQWLSDAMYMVGLSDYWHLEMEAGVPGFSIEYQTDVQLERFTQLMELGPPELADGRASWPNVLVQPGVEGEVEAKAFDPNQPRWPRGTPRAGQWRPKLDTQLPGSAERFAAAIKPIQRELRKMGMRARTDPEKLAWLGSMIDDLASSYSTVDAYRLRRDQVAEEVGKFEAQADKISGQLNEIQDRLNDYFIGPTHKLKHPDDLTPKLRAERDALVEQQDTLFKRVGKIHDELARLWEEKYRLSEREERAYRDSLVGVLSALRPMGGKLRADSAPLTPMREGGPGESVEQELARRTRKHEETLREVQRLLPSDWFDQMNETGQAHFIVGYGVRGMHTQHSDWIPPVFDEAGQQVGGGTTERNSMITVRSGDAACYLHEITHREQTSTLAGVGALRHKAEEKYLERRTGTMYRFSRGMRDLTTPLYQLLPGSGYKDDEIAIADEFAHPYYGKMYGDDYHGLANELLTMAIQDTFYNPQRLREKDPQTLEWMLGILAAT